MFREKRQQIPMRIMKAAQRLCATAANERRHPIVDIHLVRCMYTSAMSWDSFKYKAHANKEKGSACSTQIMSWGFLPEETEEQPVWLSHLSRVALCCCLFVSLPVSSFCLELPCPLPHQASPWHVTQRDNTKLSGGREAPANAETRAGAAAAAAAPACKKQQNVAEADSTGRETETRRDTRDRQRETRGDSERDRQRTKRDSDRRGSRR